jgi:hypothetical protein
MGILVSPSQECHLSSLLLSPMIWCLMQSLDKCCKAGILGSTIADENAMSEVEVQNKSDKDLLVEAITVLSDLKEEWAKVCDGAAFARCQVRGEKIEKLESGLMRLRNTTICAGVTIMATLIINWFMRQKLEGF